MRTELVDAFQTMYQKIQRIPQNDVTFVKRNSILQGWKNITSTFYNVYNINNVVI